MLKRVPLLVVLAALAVAACRNSDSPADMGPAGGGGTTGAAGGAGMAGAGGNTTGTAGAAGTTVTTGIAGAAGTTVTTGIAGAAGTTVTTGIAGAAGTTVTTGIAGAAGTTVTTGIAGAAGTTVTTGIAGAAGGTTGAAGRGGTGGNSTCATAAENGACNVEGSVCGSCTDICQFCNLLRCTSGHWQRQEAAPAPCFACGTSLQCQRGAQYCEAMTGGPVGSTTQYHCRQFPTTCPDSPTCGCLGLSSPNTCSQNERGDAQVTINAS